MQNGGTLANQIYMSSKTNYKAPYTLDIQEVTTDKSTQLVIAGTWSY